MFKLDNMESRDEGSGQNTQRSSRHTGRSDRNNWLTKQKKIQDHRK